MGEKANNYFRVGPRRCFFFNDRDEASMRAAWELADTASKMVSMRVWVFRAIPDAPPWGKVRVIGENPDVGPSRVDEWL